MSVAAIYVFTIDVSSGYIYFMMTVLTAGAGAGLC